VEVEVEVMVTVLATVNVDAAVSVEVAVVVEVCTAVAVPVVGAVAVATAVTVRVTVTTGGPSALPASGLSFPPISGWSAQAGPSTPRKPTTPINRDRFGALLVIVIPSGRRVRASGVPANVAQVLAVSKGEIDFMCHSVPSQF
jgi:hypothetical protein